MKALLVQASHDGDKIANIARWGGLVSSIENSSVVLLYLVLCNLDKRGHAGFTAVLLAMPALRGTAQRCSKTLGERYPDGYTVVKTLKPV